MEQPNASTTVSKAGGLSRRSAISRLLPTNRLIVSFGNVATGYSVAVLVIDGVEVNATGIGAVLGILVAIMLATVAYLLFYPAPLKRWIMRWPERGLSGCLLTGAVLGVGVTVSAPFGLWLGLTGSGLLGLPVEVTSLWPVLVGGCLAEISRIAVWILLRTPSRENRASGAHHQSARLVICLLALWLAVATLERVRLDQGEAWRQLLTLAVLAMLFSMVELWRGSQDSAAFVPRLLPLLALYSVLMNGLMLGAVSWVSRSLALSLHLGGWGGLAQAAVLCTAVMWVGNLPLLLLPLARAARSGWRSGKSVEWIAALRPSRYGYRWAAKPKD
ncbi:hypothetical protein O7626_10815 [Micromonospora sp. WMMD1102]|uniref:hypothetical protein n=1 Tax=Micromonospora sp. WMMD1102 TaxID=3016105 RepID=UPI0024159611|nr:hypothetical protein [Micromonospora sp. WMMD1102]MDG4786414.1 hypothetical protein [Micromonospora sp. WMMD1102]